LILRMICSRAGVDFADVTGNNLHIDAPKAMTACANIIRKSPIFIDDTGGLTANQVKARARRMVQKHGVKLVVVDYLQLMSGKKSSKENRQSEIADISKEMKSLAKELNIPVMVLAQLNREIEKDKGRCPRLSDLRESGAIEQDADIVLMPWHQQPEEDAHPHEIPVKIYVAKQRSGPDNRFIPLVFQKQFTRFIPKPTYIDESDIPPML